MIKHTPQFLRQRQLMTMLPVLTLPFLTGIFWALGGGKGAQTSEQATSPVKGFNTELPGARLKGDREFDKLGFYQQAQRDSLKRLEALRNDPYAQPVQSRQLPQADTMTLIKPSAAVAASGYPASQSYSDKAPFTTAIPSPGLPDPNEEKVKEKLAQLYREMEKQPLENASSPEASPTGSAHESEGQFGSDVDRLERMMGLLGSQGEQDPEMQQLEGTLEKILDIQHPERVRERIRDQSLKHREQVYPVQVKEEPIVSLLQPILPRINNNGLDNVRAEQADTLYRVDASSERAESGFYGLEESVRPNQPTGQAVAAVIHRTQTLTAGATVKLRLLDNLYVNGQLIPKDAFVYGTCALQNERLIITVNTIWQEHSLYSVSLSAYDLDGLEGLSVPGSLTRDAARQASTQAVGAIDLPSLDPSPEMRAASVGLNAFKGLLGRKVKQVKVTVKAGYRVLLRDTHSPE